MKKVIYSTLIFLFISSCNGQSFNENSIELYQQYSANKGYDIFYQKDSETPYTGQLVSTSQADKVFINFENGKIDKKFVKLNSKGDTLEVREYDKGIELYSIYYNYADGKLIERKENKEEKGDNQDLEIFQNALTLIKDNKFEELDDYLNPMFPIYKNMFLKLESLFGQLQDFEIQEIKKKYVEHQKSEHLRAKINLRFQNKQIEAGFLIVEYTDKLVGQGFSFPSFDSELIEDNIITKIINAINNKDIDQIIQSTQFTEQHRDLIIKDFEKIGKISGTPQFLNSHFSFLNEILLVKNYLVTMNEEKQVLSLTYKINESNEVELLQFSFLPYRKLYMIMYKRD